VNALYSRLVRFLADLPLLVHGSVNEREGREVWLFVGHVVLVIVVEDVEVGVWLRGKLKRRVN